jgi:hypothetical protein
MLPALRGVLAAHVPDEEWELSTGPAFVFPDILPATTEATFVEPGHEGLLAEHFPFTATWLRERWPCYAIIMTTAPFPSATAPAGRVP